MTLLAAAPVWAQVHSRPTEPPIVTAENEQWYKLGEPLQVGGDLYYPAGPQVFFNGNTMVRTAHYNGVPLYADTTIEPYSVDPRAGGARHHAAVRAAAARRPGRNDRQPHAVVPGGRGLGVRLSRADHGAGVADESAAADRRTSTCSTTVPPMFRR